MAKLDPRIIRAGDSVRVLNSRTVLRVGYPKCIDDYLDEAEKTFGPLLDATFKLRVDLRSGARNPQYARAIRELAYLYLRRDKFGGPERTLHFSEPDAYWKNKVYRVTGTKTVMTGTYYGPSWTPPSYDEMWGEMEPGGLYPRKPERLVELSLPILTPAKMNGGPWFWAGDLEKVI